MDARGIRQECAQLAAAQEERIERAQEERVKEYNAASWKRHSPWKLPVQPQNHVLFYTARTLNATAQSRVTRYRCGQST